MTPLLLLMLAQAALGGVDNLVHHELEAALPQRPGARLELQLHAAREAIYGALFLGLAWLEWRGAFAVLVAGLMVVEIVITLKDFLVEDRTRRLPPFERVLHTVLAIGFGAILALIAPVLIAWGREPTALAPTSHGLISWAMTLVGVGVAAWAVRNTLAVLDLGRAEAAISTAAAEGAVLVTGATGFIGRRLTAALLAQKRRVVLLTRDRMAARAQFGVGPMVVESLDELPDELRLDAVVNLAGASVAGGLWTRGRRRVLTDSRLETTRRLLAFMARLDVPPRVLVSASAVGFYGDRGGELLDDSDPRGAGFMADLCAGWEAAAAQAEGLGVRVVRLRLGLVLDWSGGLLPMLALPARFGLAARIGDGRQWAPWVHRDDVVRLVLAAIDNPAWRGPINAVAPDLVTQGELTRRLAAHLRRPQWLAAPAAPIRLALGELSDLFLASQRVIPSAALDLGFVFSRPTLESAFAPAAGPLRLAAPSAIATSSPPRAPPTLSSRPEPRASEVESRDLLPAAGVK